MLIHIDELVSPFFEEFRRGVSERHLQFYASEIQKELGFSMNSQLSEAVRRAMSVCRSQQLSLDHHFKAVYRCRKNEIVKDWKLSKLGYCLVMLNCDPVFPEVARLQLRLLRKHMGL
ncbi:hypothetical protein [Nafulsella turpanensis]|uniref:hypothetical protein n=1 Tax=Nafulsella turpanensis TaxID=1265690 RepID=UPI00034D7287|nr:hypothetical protein [Nafulsella turpanensis]